MKITFEDDLVKRLPAKEMFDEVTDGRYEEKGMSPFIVENIDRISNITGYNLKVIGTETFVGPFRADIVCQDVDTDEIVIIENQFENSDHDHLGKCITYLSNLGAKGVIWINENFRPEHKKALEVLNEITGDDYNFFGLTLIHKLHGTEHTCKFEEIVVPTHISKLAEKIKSGMNVESKNFAVDFWGEFASKLPVDIANKFKYYYKPYAKVNINKDIKLCIGYKTSKKMFDITIQPKNDTNIEQYAEEHNFDKLFGEDYNITQGKKNKDWFKIELYTESYDENPYDVMDDVVNKFVEIFNKLK